MTLEQEEWDFWLTHPVTQQYRSFLAARLAALKEDWATAQFSSIADNAHAIGAAKTLQELLVLDADTINGEMNDAT